MARFLRSSNFILFGLRQTWLKSITLYSRNNCFLQKDFQVTTINALPLASLPKFKNEIVDRQSLEKHIDLLDMYSKYKSHIPFNDVEKVLKALEKWGDVTHYHALILLKCCGSTNLDLDPDKRLELLDQVVMFFEKAGLKLSILHYHTLLSAYLENDIDFCPDEFIKIMRQKGLEPNKTTYQKILNVYCKRGDITKASKILEIMQDKDFSINVDVLNSLILGYSEKGDMKGARDILGLMKERNIDPNSVTFSNLLCGYAKQGDLIEMNNVFEECHENDIVLHDKELLHIIYYLALNNHHTHIKEIIEKLPRNPRFRTRAKTVILRLLQRKYDSIALKVFETTLDEFPDDPDVSKNHGRFLIQYYAEHRSAEEALWICRYMEKRGLCNSSRHILLRHYMTLKNEDDKVYEFLTAMKQSGFIMRTHYFWPLLIRAFSNEGNDGLFKIIEKIHDLGLKICFKTFKKIILPKYNFDVDWTSDIEKFLKQNVNESVVLRALFQKFLEDKKEDDVIKLISSYPFPYLSEGIQKSLTEYAYQRQNPDFLVNIMYILLHDAHLNEVIRSSESDSTNLESENESSDSEEVLSNSKDAFVSFILFALLNICNEKFLINTLQAMLVKKIRVPSDAQTRILGIFNSEEVQEMLKKLSDPNLLCDLDKTLLDIKYSEDKSEGRKSTLYDTLRLVLKLVSRNKYDEGLVLCKTACHERKGDFSNEEKQLFRIILMKIAKLGNMQAVENFYEAGIKYNILSKFNYFPLIYCLLENGDLKGAVDLFCEKAIETNHGTAWGHLIKHLVENKNADLLQQVTDTLSRIKGEEKCLGMLIAQFSGMLRKKEIEKLIESKEFTLPKITMILACSLLYKANSMKGLETLLEATKYLQYPGRFLICQQLLNLYRSNKKYDKIKELMCIIEEQDIYVNPDFVAQCTQLIESRPKILNQNVVL